MKINIHYEDVTYYSFFRRTFDGKLRMSFLREIITPGDRLLFNADKAGLSLSFYKQTRGIK